MWKISRVFFLLLLSLVFPSFTGWPGSLNFVLWSENYWFPKTLTKQERPHVCWDADKMVVVFLWIWISSFPYFVSIPTQGLSKFCPRETFKFSFHFNSGSLSSWIEPIYFSWTFDTTYSNFKKISKKTGHNALVLLPILRPFLFIRELIFKWSSCISHERPTPLHSDAIWSYSFQSAMFVCFVLFCLYLTPSEMDSSNLFGDLAQSS